MALINYKCDFCGENVLRQHWFFNYYKKFYCDKTCQSAGNVKYTPEALKFVQENINIMRLEDIAKHLKVTVAGLTKQIVTWRKWGEEIPFKKRETRNGVNVEKSKSRSFRTDNMKRPEPKISEKLIDKPLVKCATQRVKKEVKKLITKEIDTTGKHWVKTGRSEWKLQSI